jgi:hypothetical protein
MTTYDRKASFTRILREMHCDSSQNLGIGPVEDDGCGGEAGIEALGWSGQMISVGLGKTHLEDSDEGEPVLHIVVSFGSQFGDDFYISRALPTVSFGVHLAEMVACYAMAEDGRWTTAVRGKTFEEIDVMRTELHEILRALGFKRSID